jgi:hypothetical protein
MPRLAYLLPYLVGNDWRAGDARQWPDHIWYGLGHFARRGYQAVVIETSLATPALRVADRVQQRGRWRAVGNVNQQLQVLRRRHEIDLIYVPCEDQRHIVLLRLLRAARVLRVPIVCIAHHQLRVAPGRRQALLKAVVRGTDAFPALSSAAMSEINSFAHDHARSVALRWGPDAHFYGKPTAGRGVIAAGRTHRDFETLAAAASSTGVATRIFCLEGQAPTHPERFAANVEIVAQPEDRWMTTRELLPNLSAAAVHAIPLLRTDYMCGITSLLDALALGKPVIMTRNRHIDIDIEREGIGHWVELGDVEGWRRELEWFAKHEAEAGDMGRRARALVDSGLNSESFADAVMDIFDSVLGIDTHEGTPTT